MRTKGVGILGTSLPRQVARACRRPLTGVGAGDRSGAGEGAGSDAGTSEEAAPGGQAACSRHPDRPYGAVPLLAAWTAKRKNVRWRG